MVSHCRFPLSPFMNTRRTYQSHPHNFTSEVRVFSEDHISEGHVSEDRVSEDHASNNSVSEHSLSFLSSQDPLTSTMADVLKALVDANAKIAELERAAKNPSFVGQRVKIGQPTPFDGKVSKYFTFMSQCQLHFTMYPDSFFFAESKVLFVIFFLIGNARSWATDILNQKTHPLRKDYDSFKAALNLLYLDQNLRHQAYDKLSHLKQTKSTAAYSVEFQQIIIPLKLDNNAKCIFFYIGFKDTVKDTLATVGEPELFEELIDQVIVIDQRQHQRRIKKKKISLKLANPVSVSNSGTTKNENGKRPVSALFSRPSTLASSFKSRDKPDKSQLRPLVSNAEKKRRRKNKLCFYCGKADHRIGKCSDRSISASMAVSQYSFLLTLSGNGVKLCH